MSPDKYTPEQISDVSERESKALKILEELQLSPAVSMQMQNIGNDQFVVKPYPYLQDTKFAVQAPVKSPSEFLPPEKA